MTVRKYFLESCLKLFPFLNDIFCFAIADGHEFVFSVLVLVVSTFELSVSLLVKSCSCLSVRAVRWMSSAKRRLQLSSMDMKV